MALTINRSQQQQERDAAELEELRAAVDCCTVLERAGWKLDARESTKGAAKYRAGAGRIVIVIHGGRGWFAPLGDARGDVLALARYIWGGTLGNARQALRPLAGIAPALQPMDRKAEEVEIDAAAAWHAAQEPRRGSQGWTYLTTVRGLPAGMVDRALRGGALREGVYGTIWAMHREASGQVTGWEMRGSGYKGFVKGGSKALFWVGNPVEAERMAVTESAIDALSLATLEGWPSGTVYASTGGGYGPRTAAVMRALLAHGAEVTAAFDQGTGGEILAGQLGNLAKSCGVRFAKLVPTAKDWNAQLTGEN